MGLDVTELKPIGVYGCGGFGREVAMAVRAGSQYRVASFFDDALASDASLNGVPVAGGFEALKNLEHAAALFLAIGSIPAHHALTRKIEQLDRAFTFPSIIHPNATTDRTSVRMGIGNYIAAGARLTTDIRLGDFNVINLNCVVAHDVVIGNRCQLGPGAVLNGGVVIQDDVIIGAGAVLMPRIEVGFGAVVGIGAVVGSSVAPLHTVVGNPARVVRSP